MNVNYIPESQVIAIAKQQLSIFTDNYNDFFSLQIEGLLSTVYSPAIYNDWEILVEVCDGAFLAPKGSRRLWGVNFCIKQESSQTQYTDIDGLPILINPDLYPIITPASDINYYNFNQYIQKQDNYYYLRFPHNDELYARIWYEGFGVDENGNILIPEHYQWFLADGICARYYMCFPQNGDPRISMALADRFNRSYSAKKKQVNGEDQVVRFKERASLLRFAQSKIRMSSVYWSNFNFNYGNY